MGNFDEFFPFDKGFGSSANSARWRKMAQLWAPDGVVQGYQNTLNATLSGSIVTMNTGAVFIHGYYAELLNTQAIVNVIGNGTIVAKADLVNEVCSIYYKSGAIDYAGYEQSVSNWEIPLWLVTGGTTLTDLRTLVSGGASLAWSTSLASVQPVTTGQTLNINFLYPRIAYPTQVRMTGSALITFTDASTLQTATVSLVYQYGLGDYQSTPAITLQWPGGGPAGVAVTMPVSLGGRIPVTQGKKSVGWLVTAGSGIPQITVSAMAALLEQVQAGAQTAS